MKKFWFYTMGWKRCGESAWNYTEGVSSTHPVQELINRRRGNRERVEEWNRKWRELGRRPPLSDDPGNSDYYLHFYAEITEEQYNEWDGLIG